MIKRWLPLPVTSVALLVIWLLINQTLSPGHLLLGLILAISIPLATRSLQPYGDPVMAKPLIFMRLMAMAMVEIVRSCFNVSSIILQLNPGRVKSQFISIPLDLHNPYGLAMLSCLVNTTPGTVWVEILPEKHVLALHVFDLQDPQWWIETIKTRYEKPLIEIFESRSPS